MQGRPSPKYRPHFSWEVFYCEKKTQLCVWRIPFFSLDAKSHALPRSSGNAPEHTYCVS